MYSEPEGRVTNEASNENEHMMRIRHSCYDFARSIQQQDYWHTLEVFAQETSKVCSVQDSVDENRKPGSHNIEENIVSNNSVGETQIEDGHYAYHSLFPLCNCGNTILKAHLWRESSAVLHSTMKELRKSIMRKKYVFTVLDNSIVRDYLDSLSRTFKIDICKVM